LAMVNFLHSVTCFAAPFLTVLLLLILHLVNGMPQQATSLHSEIPMSLHIKFGITITLYVIHGYVPDYKSALNRT
jgi:hypothetical protein